MTEEELNILDAQVACSELNYCTMKEAITKSILRYEDLLKAKTPGVMTGFSRFDNITGGLKKSHMVVVSGSTNSGKSTFTKNLVNNVLADNIGVAYFSLEEETEEIIDSLICMNSLIYRNKFNTGRFSQHDVNKIMATSVDLSKRPLYVFDDPNMSMDDIRNSCLLLGAQNPIGLIVIDYIQLVNTGSFRDNREQQVAHISRSIKALAKECQVPIIALSQLNEGGEVRESRAIAHDANVVIKLSGNPPDITAKVTKGRSIPKGEYYFKFENDIALMKEVGCDEKLERMLESLANK